MAKMPPERAGLRYGSGGAQDWFLTLACVAPGTGKQSLRDDATALKRYDGKRGNGIERAQRQNGMTPAKRYNRKREGQEQGLSMVVPSVSAVFCFSTLALRSLSSVFRFLFYRFSQHTVSKLCAPFPGSRLSSPPSAGPPS